MFASEPFTKRVKCPKRLILEVDRNFGLTLKSDKRSCVAILASNNVARERLGPLPPLGEAVDDLDVFVAGEAEVDKPFAVEQPRRLLQQRNPPPVVLDEVVVGGEDEAIRCLKQREVAERRIGP